MKDQMTALGWQAPVSVGFLKTNYIKNVTIPEGTTAEQVRTHIMVDTANKTQ